MTIYNRDFAKQNPDGTPAFAPMPLRLEIPHHDEWDESVIDPETGEPTGETEHKTHDWDETYTVIHPTAADFALMGYLPLRDEYPTDPAPDGRHWERTPFIEANGNGGYRWTYTLVANPPPPPRRWTRLDILTALGESNMFDAAVAYLNSIEVKPHITAWLGLNTANYIEEGYPDAEKWNALLDGAAVALGKTREEIDAFLDAIPTEG